MIEIWSAGKIATENAIFFKSPSSEKAYLIHKGQKTLLPTRDFGEFYQGEFRVSLPGEYTLSIGHEAKSFDVLQYQRLSMQFELALTIIAVAAFFLVLAFKRRQKHELK